MSDAALRRLERAHEAAPEDPDTARAYLRALEQRGERGERVHALWALLLRERYGVSFPPDLFQAWEFCRDLAEERGQADVRSVLWGLGIQLGGPFDLIARGLAELEPPELPLVMHVRYYLDPPEFFTVAFGDSDGLHWGYWFDDPDGGARPVVCSYYNNDAYEITECGATLLEAVEQELAELVELAEDDEEDEHGEDERLVAPMNEVRSRIGRWHERYPPPEVEREPSVPTFEGMGLVLPGVSPADVLPLEVLYELAEDPEEAKPLLDQARGDLEQGRLHTALQIARALWTMQGAFDLHPEAAELMARCYEGLDRPTLAWVTRTQALHRSIPSVNVFDP